jgi:hypothetical protein
MGDESLPALIALLRVRAYQTVIKSIFTEKLQIDYKNATAFSMCPIVDQIKSIIAGSELLILSLQKVIVLLESTKP